MTRGHTLSEPTSGRILGEKTAVLVMQALLEALTDPFTEVSFERRNEAVCPLCGGAVVVPTKMRPTYKCKNQQAYENGGARCDWSGKEPAREIRLTIDAITRAT